MIPWTICTVTPEQTFLSLYEKLCAGSLELFEQFASKLSHKRLATTFVGPAKDNLSSAGAYPGLREGGCASRSAARYAG